MTGWRSGLLRLAAAGANNQQGVEPAWFFIVGPIICAYFIVLGISMIRRPERVLRRQVFWFKGPVLRFDIAFMRAFGVLFLAVSILCTSMFVWVAVN